MHEFVSRIAFGVFLFWSCATCGPSAFAAVDGQDQAALAPGGDLGLEQLLRERVAAARDFYAAAKASYEHGTTTLDIYTLALRERRSAELDSATTRDQRVRAHRTAITAAQALEAKIKGLYDGGSRGGEAEKYGYIKEFRLETEIRLAEESSSARSGAQDQDAGATPRISPDNEAQATLDKLQELRRARVEAARYGLEACRAAYETETITLGVLVLAIRELLDAELDAAAASKERITAISDALGRARAVEAKVKALSEAAARGGEAEKLAHIHSTRLDFEIRLMRERQRQAAQAGPATEK